MDKKSTIIGILLLVTAFVLMTKQARDQAEWQRQQKELEERTGQTAPGPGKAPGVEGSENGGATPVPGIPVNPEVETTSPPAPENGIGVPVADPGAGTTTPEPTEVDRPPERIETLSNNFVEVAFTNYGGAIKSVTFFQHLAVKDKPDKYVFNAGAETPALAIKLAGQMGDGPVSEFAPVYETQVDRGKREIVFTWRNEHGVRFERTYRLSGETEGPAPYLIEHVTRFVNTSAEQTVSLPPLFVNVGTAPPLKADPSNWYLNFSYYDGDDAEFISLNEFKSSSGFLGLGRREGKEAVQNIGQRTVWAAVKNQFFCGILTPKEAAGGFRTSRAELPPWEGEAEPREGITGSVAFKRQPSIPPGGAVTLEMSYYAGPKEYPRLKHLTRNEDVIMQFGWFAFFSKGLLYALIALQGIIPGPYAYGFAIIAMTIVIRLILYPLTAKAARTSKKMAKIQKPMQELREKYKDKPEKLQKATMQLFREHEVNPMAGCLPVLVQIPIFIAFFYMLRTSSELRFQEFIWIKDLSQPENIFSWGINIPVLGAYFNLLPILMGVTMHYQMKMTPTTLDSAQQKIFAMMPWIFLVICYTFSSGLVLYWTVSNCFSIVQQVITNRSKDDGGPVGADPDPPGGGGKPGTGGKTRPPTPVGGGGGAKAKAKGPKRGKKRYRKPSSS